ncbi:MAG: glycoside hydrolase family 2, partial [Candidatus Heimdallarchaeota archaeon]
MVEGTKWSKKEGRMQTQWYSKVTSENPLPDYPRPQMKRKDWQNLNGLWNYTVTSAKADFPNEFEGKILVPFAIESPLSGVKRQLYPK